MRFLTPLLFATVAIACGSAASDGDNSAAAATATGTCQVTNQITGATMSVDELSKIDDPIAKLILTTEGCPLAVADLAEKLRKTDTGNCPDQGPGKQASGVSTRMIGEAAMEANKAGNYRIVTARDCGGRPQFGLLMSGNANASGVGQDFLEIITQNKTTGVFDYYSQEKGQWTFFGTSADFVESGYTCKSGQCTPKIASQTRCAACHPGGGLNMKELHSPWVFWDVGALPGAAETIAKTPDVLGSRGSGIDLEGRVGQGNQSWVPKRLGLLKAKGSQEVLRGLFCTLAMNLQTAGGNGESLSSIPGDFLVDRTFPAGGVQVNPADYKTLLGSTASQLPGGTRDTPFAFIYPERSAEDLLYQQELINEKIVDDDFVRDVRNVDFTRPTYSTARCDLLSLAPNLTGDQLNPTAIREGFKTALAGQSSAAAVKLLANLNAVNDQAAHQAEVTTFISACNARPKADFLKDAVAWASHLRQTARATSRIIEFSATLPQDNQADTNGAFNPTTCVLEN